MEWFYNSLSWYAYLFVLGIIFFPLTRKIFSRFFDEGYAFSKTIAILFLTYASFILGIAKVIPFTQQYLYIIIIFFGFINFFILIRDIQKNKPQIAPVKSKTRKTKAVKSPSYSLNPERTRKIFIFIIEEILFLGGILFLAYVRSQEPSVRGLEKFMDFGFMNSILRSTHFPPLDMWYSSDPTKPGGYPINYYYFGHLTGAYLIKLTGMNAFVGYNLILATILAQGVSMAFSLTANIVYKAQGSFLNTRWKFMKLVFFGLVGSYLVNFAGNLHTIYLFTTGYPNDKPIPFWNIISILNPKDGAPWYNPAKYWYPNATRFIPFTIHEFPSYSYVVADLHGHVFDIPFVLLSLAVLSSLFFTYTENTAFVSIQNSKTASKKSKNKEPRHIEFLNFFRKSILDTRTILTVLFLGFLAAVHYMTNAFDGPIYILLAEVIFFLLFGLSMRFFWYSVIFVGSFALFSFPFTYHFIPFVSGIGVNCAPDFLINLSHAKQTLGGSIQAIGPFIFEKGKCQSSPLWMMFVLWGFFWVSFILLAITSRLKKQIQPLDRLFFVIFAFGTFLIIIPEFFYIKDIYPDHFRANTMFKLGYQAFIMMSVASAYTLYAISSLEGFKRYILKFIYLFFFFFVVIYPFFAFPSYYGALIPLNNAVPKPPELDGSKWLISAFPEDKEIIEYINTNIKGQPNILEAQGDSYTDYERISAYTGLPTVAGWWVHEWLWRGTADVVGKRIPDIVSMYEGTDPAATLQLLKKYNVKYVVVANQERTKYPNLHEEKFESIAKKIFVTSNQRGALYEVNY